MSRFAGRNGVLYLGLTNNGAAVPFAFLTDWSINKTVGKYDVTAMGDPNMVYVSGIPDSAGDFSFWYDDATAQTYAAAADGLSRTFYLYENALTSPTNYWCGTMLPDFQITGAVAAAVSGKSAWNAAGRIDRYRAGVIG